MGLYKRGKKWYCSIADPNGKLIRKSLSTDKRVAERILAQMREQFELQKFGLLPKELPKSQDRKKPLEAIHRDFLQDMALKGRSDSYFDNFESLWLNLVVSRGVQTLSGINLKVVQQWAAAQLEKGNKGQSINQRVSLIKGFTRWCVKQGHYDSDPLAGWEPLPPDDKRFRRDLSETEVAAISAAEWDDEYRLRWAVYFATGLRNTAGSRLSWEWLDWQGRILILPVRSNKSKKELRIPMHPQLYDLLRKRWEAVGRPARGQVFRQVNRKNILKRFKTVCSVAGVDLTGVCLHSVRHTAATKWYKASGKNLKAVQELLGHSDISTTALYLHVDEEITRNAVESAKLPFGM